MTWEMVKAEVYICCKKIEELRLKAPEMRRQHLKNRLQHHRDRGDEKAAAAVLRILHREASVKRWRRVHRTTKRDRGQACLTVRVQTEEGVDEIKTKDGVFATVSENLAERFRLAFSAPACQPGQLFDDIGFLGDTEAASRILENTYEYPPDTDPATKLLLQEAASMYARMTDEEVATFVTAEGFQYYWQRVNERISSSYSRPTFWTLQGCIFRP